MGEDRDYTPPPHPLDTRDVKVTLYNCVGVGDIAKAIFGKYNLPQYRC